MAKRPLEPSRPGPSLRAKADIRVTTLPNGTVVATERMEGIRSASLGVYLDTGSRDEKRERNGIAHFFEHMVFKGTARHSALELVQAFEGTGGQVNAYTSKEQTCFYAKVTDSEVPKGLSILLDMTLSATFPAEEVVKEKEVIIEEIKGANDNPEDYIYDLFSQAYFGDHALGMPIAGTEESVRGLSRKYLLDHQKRARETLPLFVVAVGKVVHAEVVALTEEAFARLDGRGGGAGTPGTRRPGSARKPFPRRPFHPKPGHLVERRKVQQANVILGGPGYAQGDPRRYPLLILHSVLGDGMSSRLFQNLREDHGLVYSIYSNPEFLDGMGGFSIGFGTEARHLEKAMREIGAELRRLKKDGITEAELDFAKKSLSGGVLLGLESSYTRMGHLSRLLMNPKGEKSIEEALRNLDKVRLADIRACVAEVFDVRRWGSAAILPTEGKGGKGKKGGGLPALDF